MTNGLLPDALREQLLRIPAVLRRRGSFSDTVLVTSHFEPRAVALPWTFDRRVHRRMEPTRSRSMFGDAVLLMFLFVQVCDGVLTYMGVQLFGPTIEGNPILAWYMASAGVLAGIVSMKLFAVLCGAILHLHARHRTIGLLTVFYLGAAVWQWTVLLASTGL